MEITPHPKTCQNCRTQRANICLRRSDRMGRVTEEWVCYDCYAARDRALQQAIDQETDRRPDDGPTQEGG